MSARHQESVPAKSGARLRLLLALATFGGLCARETSSAQTAESQAGEAAAEALKKQIEARQYDLQYGPVRMKVDARVGVNYTDNVFFSHNPREDLMINPEVDLGALWPVSRFNTLELSLGLSYEWYLKNKILNADAPLINPGSELAFNIFAGDVHIRLHDRFSYEQSLFFNTFTGDSAAFFNFNNVGTFSRLDNQAGLDATWDLNRAVLAAGYNHEDFDSSTSSFEYLNRSSELFTGSAGLKLGDHLQIGPEAQAAVHRYERETILNNNWRVRTGPYVEATFLQGFKLRAGGGFDTARYDAAAAGGSDYDTYYAYARIQQETRLFSHSLRVGRETLLGDNANNLKTLYARYSISTPIVTHMDLGANISVNSGEEFGGVYYERFTYYDAGVRAEYQFNKHWRAELGYAFRLKRSDLPLLNYHRNQVTLGVGWEF